MYPSLTPSEERLSAEDMKALEIAHSLDTTAAKEAYERLTLERWKDWTGEKSVELGFPEIKSQRERLNVAMLLENQNRFQRSRERRVVKRGDRMVIVQDVQTGDESLPTNFALAMVRRAYALTNVMDWGTTQVLPGPTGYVFYIDYLREGDTTNLLSPEYGYAKVAEGAVPPKAKIKIARDLVTADKQLMASVFTLEAEEDALAQLGLNIANEMVSTFTVEFIRNRFAEHLQKILTAALAGGATGSSLPTLWSNANGTITIPAQGAFSLSDWKQAIYNSLQDGQGEFIKVNRQPADGIVCGIDMAVRFQKANQAVDVSGMAPNMESDLGVNSFGHFAGRFHVWATDLLAPNQGFLYKRNPDPLRAGFVYAPYVPVQVMPAVYGGYQTADGRYTNTDEYTRNIRERSASIVTRPYAFVPLTLG